MQNSINTGHSLNETRLELLVQALMSSGSLLTFLNFFQLKLYIRKNPVTQNPVAPKSGCFKIRMVLLLRIFRILRQPDYEASGFFFLICTIQLLNNMEILTY